MKKYTTNIPPGSRCYIFDKDVYPCPYFEWVLIDDELVAQCNYLEVTGGELINMEIKICDVNKK